MKFASMFFPLLAAVIFFAGCDQPSSTTAPLAAPGASSTPDAASGVVLTASPNPVPASSGAGTTRITWTSGGRTAAAIYVSADGSEEKLFAEGSEGSSEAAWIQPGATYEFRLYANADRKDVLARVQVAQAK